MAGLRLSIAVENDVLHLPDNGTIAVFAPRAKTADLSMLPKDRCQVVTGFKPDVDHFSAQGFTCLTAPDRRYSAALICLPRSKTQAQMLIAQAATCTDGPVIIDGAKTDGVESILKGCRKRIDVSPAISKAHGKLFWFTACESFADWHVEPHKIEDGFQTAPGVFSADGVDLASRLLADTLPKKLGAHVVDLGGGWGYLSARALERPTITCLDLIEADHVALNCAAENITDPRVHLHWADATKWRPKTLADCIITNPPFHTDRNADPALGQAFIGAAKAMLKPSGHLWLVANRHLPYEVALEHQFVTVEEAAGDNRFKILHATRPSRQGR